MTPLPTKEVKCQQDGKKPRSFGDENKGQSSTMEWGGQSPRNANSNFTAERVSRAEGSGKGSMCVSARRSKRGVIVLTGSTACLEAGGAGPPSFAEADSKL